MFEKKTWILICLALSMAVQMANALELASGDEEAGVEEGSNTMDEAAPEEASGEEAISEDAASGEDAVPEDEGEVGDAPTDEEENAEAEADDADDADPEVDGSGEGANGSGDEAQSVEGSGAEATDEEGEGEANCEIVEDASGDSIEALLALGTKKCKESRAEAEAEAEGGAEELAATLFQCNMDGMDEKVAECMSSLDERVGTLEQATLSGEGGGLEEQITLVLVKKGVIDCDNNTQCADDRACIDSYQEPGRKLCERPCDRTQCSVPYSECVATNHEAKCVCKEGFHGNGTKACFPEGFEEEANGKSYKMFDDAYVEFDNATDHCQELGARLPVLDSAETIEIIRTYLEESNFTVFEQWDRSSRRVWLGLTLDRGSGLIWVDGARIISYPASSRLFVWESRRMLSQEVSYADNSRHYALYIDGDLAKLPGGGRKGAAVLCELIPSQIREPVQQNSYQNYNSDPRYQQYGAQQPNYPSDGGYPPYAQRPGY